MTTNEDNKNIQKQLVEIRLALEMLQGEIKETKVGLVALHDENFDGNVYRKALEYAFQESVYSKIRNVLAVVLTIAGIGGFYFMNVGIERLVDSTIEKKQGEFLEASRRLDTETLEFQLQNAFSDTSENGQDVSESPAVKKIQDREEATLQKLEEFIKSGNENQQLLAIYYVGIVEEDSLLDEVQNQFEKSRSIVVRSRALDALLKFPLSDIQKIIADVMPGEPEISPLWRQLTTSLIYRKYTSIEERKLAESLVRPALKLANPEIFRSAVIFYLANDDLWAAEKVEKTGFREHRAYTSIIEDVKSRSITKERRKANFDFLSEREKSATKFGRSQIQLIKDYLTLTYLLQGDKPSFDAKFTPESFDQNFPPETWERLLVLFPDFKPDSDMRFAQESDQAYPLTNSDEFSSQQSVFFDQLQHYEWDSGSRTYIYLDPQAAVMDALAHGNFEPLRQFNYYSYLDSSNWRKVLEYFPFFREQNQEEDVFRDETFQDLLVLQLDDYDWIEEHGVFEYRYDFPEELVIELLSDGDLGPLILTLDNGGISEEGWQEVHKYFPEFHQRAESSPDISALDLQAELIDEIRMYVWMEDRRVYEKIDWETLSTKSITELRQGTTRLFSHLMARTYYEPDVWISSVFPLFSEIASKSISDQSATGSQAVQDELYYWVSEQGDRIAWDAENNRYQLND